MEFIAPLPGSLAHYCTIGTLRECLKYRSREAMARNWQSIFANEILPDDHQTVPIEQVKTFVAEIAIPRRGRPGPITGAAQNLLKSFKDIELSLKVFPDVIEKVNEKPELIPEQPKQVQPEQTELLNNVPNRFSNWLMSLTKLDVVYMVTLGIADYGLAYNMGEMGIAAAFVYTLISLHALDMAKNRRSQNTAQVGIIAVWALEVGSFFIHLTMFNRKLWSSVKELPFKVEDFENEHRVYYIAMVLAFLFASAGIYAVSTTLSLLKENIDAENFEREHGIKY